MKSAAVRTFFARVDVAEYVLCRQFNKAASIAWTRALFRMASRLGDGIVWYALILLLPLYAASGWRVALVMASTGALGVILYKRLKRSLVRERPFITHAGISLAGAPLDRYSFPSGHTLHAVSFTCQAVATFPEFGYVLVPLTLLIAGSRVVLGLHYPSDVLAGGLLGAALAALGMSLT